MLGVTLCGFHKHTSLSLFHCPLCGTCEVSDHSAAETGREWAEEVLSPLLTHTDTAQRT